MEDVNSVSSEFTKRLSEAEKKINQVIRVSSQYKDSVWPSSMQTCHITSKMLE